jgi:hypothetical protein
VAHFLRKHHVCSRFGRLHGICEPSKTRAILGSGRGSAW